MEITRQAPDSTDATLAASDSGATITVNGTGVDSGSASDPIGLTEGETRITIEVTADNDTTTAIYTLTVTRTVLSPTTLSGTIAGEYDFEAGGIDDTYDATGSVVVAYASDEVEGTFPDITYTSTQVFELYLYTDRPVAITGTEVDGADTITYDATLATGWNKVRMAFVTVADESSEVSTGTFTTDAMPADSDWFVLSYGSDGGETAGLAAYFTAIPGTWDGYYLQAALFG